jgi:ketopantoate reductase
MVLGVQNGVTAADRLSARFGVARVVGVASATTLAIGAWPRGTNARTTALVQLFKEAGINAVAHDHVIEAIWEKFLALGLAQSGLVAHNPARSSPDTPAEPKSDQTR